MIHLTRERSAACIPHDFWGPGLRETQRSLLALHAAGDAPKGSVWAKARKQLKRESGGKCAYCEAPTATVAFGDVEHFRPKADYWWLAYCWDNYVYACQLCNERYKLASFPIDGAHLNSPQIDADATPAEIDALVGTLAPDPLIPREVAAFQRLLKREAAQLPDPYVDDPEPLFSWYCDDTLHEVELRPRGRAKRAKRAAAAVDRFLGLNRPELKAARHTRYAMARLCVKVLELEPPLSDDVRADARDQLRRMIATEGEFAGMVRYLVREVHGLTI